MPRSPLRHYEAPAFSSRAPIQPPAARNDV